MVVDINVRRRVSSARLANIFKTWNGVSLFKGEPERTSIDIVQELCESRGGRPGLSVLTSLLVSVDVKLY